MKASYLISPSRVLVPEKCRGVAPAKTYWNVPVEICALRQAKFGFFASMEFRGVAESDYYYPCRSRVEWPSITQF